MVRPRCAAKVALLTLQARQAKEDMEAHLADLVPKAEHEALKQQNEELQEELVHVHAALQAADAKVGSPLCRRLCPVYSTTHSGHDTQLPVWRPPPFARENRVHLHIMRARDGMAAVHVTAPAHSADS